MRQFKVGDMVKPKNRRLVKKRERSGGKWVHVNTIGIVTKVAWGSAQELTGKQTCRTMDLLTIYWPHAGEYTRMLEVDVELIK